jgi:hypothetical protein
VRKHLADVPGPNANADADAESDPHTSPLADTVGDCEHHGLAESGQ